MAPVRPFGAYVFDFDGTLFHLPVDWRAVRRDIAAIVGPTMGDRTILRALAYASRRDRALYARLLAAVDERELPAAESAEPIEGALNVVDSIAGKAKLGMVTMQGRAACGRVLRRFGVFGKLGVLVTREDSVDRREQILMACRALGASPGETLFAGDKRSDLTSGREAGVTVASVGPRARESWGSDKFCPRLQMLKPYLPRG